jgi:hypothetical protein
VVYVDIFNLTQSDLQKSCKATKSNTILDTTPNTIKMRFRSTSRREAQDSAPPPSPPTPLPVRAAEEDIPIVFGEALPVTDGPPPVATACEVILLLDESNGTVASSYAYPANNSNYNNYMPFSNDTAARHSYPGSSVPSVGGYAAAPGSSASYYDMAAAPTRYASYAASAPPPPISQVHFPSHSTATVSTSPMSIRSTYTTTPFNSYGAPPPPTRHSISVLRASASTTTPMATNAGVQLQQLPMVNMEGRRMTPYVNKPTNIVVRVSSAGSGGANGGLNYEVRPGSRMTRYV